MQPRRDWIFSEVRRKFRRFVDSDGKWLTPPAINAHPDPRVYVQVALPYLLGTDEEKKLAENLLLSEGVTDRLTRQDRCAFTPSYVCVLLNLVGDQLPKGVRQLLLDRVANRLLHFASLDLRHHGYNDNHVTLATAALVLGGELSGQKQAVEEGRANLLNFRDTFLRRGFMHETNDCYIPHTLYTTAAVAEWSRDPEIRQLALDCEARIWADWIGHWHPNLARKPGPSARDYTGGRLHPLSVNTALWTVFGDKFGQPAYPPADAFAESLPPEHHFAYNGNPSDGTWDLGFIAWLAAHTYHIPEHLGALMYDRSYPHTICGTHEVGNVTETLSREVQTEKGKEQQREILPEEIPFSAREIFTYQYQEKDWAMGTASQRMIGNCGNNNWGVSYRKAAPLARTSDQGMIFCSFTINEKDTTGFHSFSLAPGADVQPLKVGVEHWFDCGRYAALQHERTSLVLYRPLLRDQHKIEALATSIIFPLCYKNKIDRIDLGDTEVRDFEAESTVLGDLFVQDGPLYIGIRPLLPVSMPAGVRVRVERSEFWGKVHFYSYRGPATDVEAHDLCRVGGGFLCEVATRDDFPTLEAFKSWFRRGEFIDEQQFFMRHVRYHREGLDLAMRWDILVDNIMYRAINGREHPLPRFSCTGIAPESLPWMTGDVSGLDHFRWAQTQSRRTSNWPDFPLKWGSEK
jgi:hypothetical protein